MLVEIILQHDIVLSQLLKKFKIPINLGRFITKIIIKLLFKIEIHIILINLIRRYY